MEREPLLKIVDGHAISLFGPMTVLALFASSCATEYRWIAIFEVADVVVIRTRIAGFFVILKWAHIVGVTCYSFDLSCIQDFGIN